MSGYYRRLTQPVVPFASVGDLVRADLLDKHARSHAERAVRLPEPTQEGVWVVTDTDCSVSEKERNPVEINESLVREYGDVSAVRENLLRALAATGARWAIPHSTWTLPMTNASGAKSMRLFPGTSFYHADKALRHPDWQPQYPLIPYNEALVSACGLENPESESQDVVVADTCYVFIQGDQPCVPGPTWNRQANAARIWIDDHRSTDPAVVLFTSNVGPWGGVACLFRVAEQLARYGINAQVLHFTTNVHRFNPGVGPIQVVRPHTLVKTLNSVTRVDKGVLFATHWWGEDLLQPIWDANPVWDKAAYWQDREDLFTNKRGERTLTDAQALKYAKVPNRVINAKWVQESGEKDLGIDESTVIPVGYDPAIFYPPEKPRQNKQVRILSMYRPTTPRRGDKTLLLLYRKLRERFQGAVSLEVFGEKPPHNADVDVYHGWLGEHEVAEAMRNADIVVEPSDFQGFGLPGLEAMATGAALVSTDNRGIHEYGVHNANCLIAQNHKELWRMVSDLVQKPHERVRLGEVAALSVRRFAWDVIGAEWVCWLERFPCIADNYRDSIDRAKEDLRAYNDRANPVFGLSGDTLRP